MGNIADELLSVSEEAAEPTPEVETPEPDAEPIEAEAPETGDKEPEKEPEVEPPPTETVKTVPESALVGVRKDFQKKIDELEKQLAAKDTEKPKAPSVFEDEEGAFGALRDDLSKQMTNQLLNEGEAEAIRQHDQETVEKAIEWVTEAAAKSPMLASELASTPLLQQHRKVVELYQAEQARAELENPAQLKARLKEEARQELLAEQKAEKEKQEKLAESIPKSLVGEPSEGGLKGSDWSGPTELEAVIGPGG